MSKNLPGSKKIVENMIHYSKAMQSQQAVWLGYKLSAWGKMGMESEE
jgi:hypothetical protein